MKRLAPLIAATGLVAATAFQPAAAAGSISVEIAQPGVYGRIIVGDTRPAVIYPEPVIVAPARYAPVRRPIYLHVPPGHQKKWDRHCHRYAACGQPVYFVQESWVRARHAQHRSAGFDRRDAHPQTRARDDRGRAEPRTDRHDGRRGSGHGGDHRR